MKLRRRRRPAAPSLPPPLKHPSGRKLGKLVEMLLEDPDQPGVQQQAEIEVTHFEHVSFVTGGRPRSFDVDDEAPGDIGLTPVLLDWYGAKERRDQREARRIAAYLDRWAATEGRGYALD